MKEAKNTQRKRRQHTTTRTKRRKGNEKNKDRAMKTKRKRSQTCVTHFCAKNPGQKQGKTRLSGLPAI